MAEQEAAHQLGRVVRTKKEEDPHGNVIMNKLRAHLNNDLSSLQLEEEIRYYDEQLMLRAGRLRSEKHK